MCWLHLCQRDIYGGEPFSRKRLPFPRIARDTRFETRPKLHPTLLARLRSLLDWNSFFSSRSARLPPNRRYVASRSYRFFPSRQINYLTNNCSYSVLYALAVNFTTSKRFAGRFTRHGALFINSIKASPTVDYSWRKPPRILRSTKELLRSQERTMRAR